MGTVVSFGGMTSDGGLYTLPDPNTEWNAVTMLDGSGPRRGRGRVAEWLSPTSTSFRALQARCEQTGRVGTFDELAGSRTNPSCQFDIRIGM